MYSLDHHDLGTPLSDSTQSVTVEIDGISTTVRHTLNHAEAAAVGSFKTVAATEVLMPSISTVTD